MSTRESLALALYVKWSGTSVDARRADTRWASMPDFGRRPFLELADVAIAFLGASFAQDPPVGSMAARHDAAEEAEIRL